MSEFKISLSSINHENIKTSVTFSSDEVKVETGEIVFLINSEDKIESTDLKLISSGELNNEVDYLTVSTKDVIIFNRKILFNNFSFSLNEEDKLCRFVYKFKVLKKHV